MLATTHTRAGLPSPAMRMRERPERRGWVAAFVVCLALVLGNNSAPGSGAEVAGTGYWLPISQDGAPSPRQRHTAVWTGDEMIVWGGWGPDGPTGLGDGSRYDPATDSWRPISTHDAPSPRFNHLAIWTGTEMIVWGGWGPSVSAVVNLLADGARYNPVTDSWAPLSPAPLQARESFAAVWTGAELVIWGGAGVEGREAVTLGNGARYRPSLDLWTPMSSAGAPGARWSPAAVWTGGEMVIWGGAGDDLQARRDGARYDPGTDTWRPMASEAPASAVSAQPAMWTGSEMLLWGRPAGREDIGQGARYDPRRDTWTPMSTDGAPLGRFQHTAVWTGAEMIVWGGEARFTRGGPSPLRTDAGRYNPSTDTWTAVLLDDATPSPRVLHTAVWTGTEMIIWGGAAAPAGNTNDGARFSPPPIAAR